MKSKSITGHIPFVPQLPQEQPNNNAHIYFSPSLIPQNGQLINPPSNCDFEVVDESCSIDYETEFDSPSTIYKEIKNIYLTFFSDLMIVGRYDGLRQDPNLTCYGWTLLHIITYRYSTTANVHPQKIQEIAELLITRGADINIADEAGRTPVYFGYLPKLDQLYTKTNVLGIPGQISPLHILVSIPFKSKSIEKYIELGANAYALDKYDRLPLHCAAAAYNLTSTAGYVETLIKHAPSSTEYADKFGYYPLHYALKFGETKVIRIIFGATSTEVREKALQDFPELDITTLTDEIVEDLDDCKEDILELMADIENQIQPASDKIGQPHDDHSSFSNALLYEFSPQVQELGNADVQRLNDEISQEQLFEFLDLEVQRLKLDDEIYLIPDCFWFKPLRGGVGKKQPAKAALTVINNKNTLFMPTIDAQNNWPRDDIVASVRDFYNNNVYGMEFCRIQVDNIQCMKEGDLLVNIAFLVKYSDKYLVGIDISVNGEQFKIGDSLDGFIQVGRIRYPPKDGNEFKWINTHMFSPSMLGQLVLELFKDDGLVTRQKIFDYFIQILEISKFTVIEKLHEEIIQYEIKQYASMAEIIGNPTKYGRMVSNLFEQLSITMGVIKLNHSKLSKLFNKVLDPRQLMNGLKVELANEMSLNLFMFDRILPVLFILKYIKLEKYKELLKTQKDIDDEGLFIIFVQHEQEIRELFNPII